MTIKIRRRSSFSLLEILVVLAILSAVLVGVGVNVPKLLRHEKFERAVELVLAEIKKAEDLMVIYESDVKLTLQITNEGLLCAQERNNKTKDLLIKGIEGVYFDGFEKQSIILKFCADDYSVPQGTLTFSCHGKEKAVTLNHYEKKEKAFPAL